MRQGPWKYGPASYPGGRQRPTKAGEKPAAEIPAQLYNLDSDPGETKNVLAEYPEKVKELASLLERVRAAARSRP